MMRQSESIGIHVRRGYYIGNPYFDILDLGTYYKQTMIFMAEIFLFSLMIWNGVGTVVRFLKSQV